MKARNNILRLVVIGAMALSLAGCVGYDQRAGNTMLGAGLGAAAGGVFSDGDPLYMLGGAAAGGLLGNVLTADGGYYRGRDDYYSGGRSNWNRGSDRNHNDQRRWNDRDNDHDHRNWQDDRDRGYQSNRGHNYDNRGRQPQIKGSTPFGRASRGGDNFNK